MTQLRYFADLMLQSIEQDRRLAAISRKADAYGASCARIRQDCLDARDLDSKTIAAVTEGMNAVRIITEGAKP